MTFQSGKERVGTFIARVEQVLPKIAAEDSLPQDASFLQLATSWAGQDEAPEVEECDDKEAREVFQLLFSLT